MPAIANIRKMLSQFQPDMSRSHASPKCYDAATSKGFELCSLTTSNSGLVVLDARSYSSNPLYSKYSPSDMCFLWTQLELLLNCSTRQREPSKALGRGVGDFYLRKRSRGS